MALAKYDPRTDEERKNDAEIESRVREKWLNETMRLSLTKKFADGREEVTGFYITREQAIELVQFSGIGQAVQELKNSHLIEHGRF